MFQEWNDAVKGCLQDPNGDKVATLSCVPAIFSNLLNAMLLFAGLMALIMFIMGGFKYMNSAGDPKKLDGAINNVKFGIIGLAIVLFSYLFIRIISILTQTPCVMYFGFGC